MPSSLLPTCMPASLSRGDHGKHSKLPYSSFLTRIANCGKNEAIPSARCLNGQAVKACVRTAEDEFGTRSAIAVGSVPNYAPQRLHPPESRSRRWRIPSGSRLRVKRLSFK